jgi:hypothetical protein
MKNSLKVHSTQLLTSKMSDSTTFLPRYKKTTVLPYSTGDGNTRPQKFCNDW